MSIENMNETDIADALKAQLSDQVVEMRIDAVTLFAVTSAVQLAMRHPQTPDNVLARCTIFIDAVREAINPISEVAAEVIALGNDASKDYHP